MSKIIIYSKFETTDRNPEINSFSNSESFQKVENKYSVDEKKNKKALILFKKEKSKKVISQDNRNNNSKENIASKITNNTTNNTNVNSNSKTKGKNNEQSSGIRIIKINKNKNKKKYEINNKQLKDIKEKKNNSNNNIKKPTKKINSENKKEKIKYNNYISNNKKEGSSSYIKIKINKEQPKENKSNISNYDKRRNYNVPKLRIKKTAENETRKEDTSDNYNDNDFNKQNEKEKYVQKLIENNSYIKVLQKMMEKESQTKENKDYENKRKFIEDNGYDIQSDEETNEIDNNENKNENVDDKNIVKKAEKSNINTNNNVVINNSISNNNSSNNNFNFISNNNVNMNLSGSSDKNINNNVETENKAKEKIKSSLNTFEYYDRINQYINRSELKKDYYNFNNNTNDSLGDSFRKSISNSVKKAKKVRKNNLNEISDNSSLESESNFNYDTKENKRSETEIKKYIEKKKRESKLKEEKKNKNLQAKKLNRYLVLNKLNKDIISNMNKNISKIKNEEEKKEKEKIPNEYFVGRKDFSMKRKNSNISHTTESSQSTVLDQNNYYLDLIMSKKILSNNIKNNDLINNNNELTNDNYIITTTKDKDIQNTYDVNTNNSNNKLSQEIIQKNNNDINKNDIYGELQLKCKETLEKANKFFSEKNIKAFMEQYKDKNNIEEEKNNTSEVNNINNDINNEVNNIIIDVKNNTESNNKDINKEIHDDINKNEKENINEQKNNNNDININEDVKTQEEQLIINEDKEEEKKTEENCKDNNEDDNKLIPAKKVYQFSNIVLENYYKIFQSLDDYLNSLIKKNALNDIISFGETRYSYKIGFENLIILIKLNPFNELRMLYQKEYYKSVLRQLFFPYIRRALSNINLYGFYLFKFSEVDKAIQQIYKIIFWKRLSFFAQMNAISKEEFNEKINLLNKIIRKIFYKQLLQALKNTKNFISNDINLSDKKNNTYIYESFSEKSSLTAYPNSEGSARLHKVYELLEMQRKDKNEENNILENAENNSARSVKSVEEKNNIFFNKSDNEKEENLNIPLNELKINLNKENKDVNNSSDVSYKGCIKKIEITNNFKINKNNIPENNNNIILEANEKKSRNNNINENKEKNNEIIKENIDTITTQSKNNNYTITNTTNEIIKISENNTTNKSELSDNNRYPKSNTLSERNEIHNEINTNINIKNNILKNIPEKNIQKISDDLCNNIITELILSEISDNKKLLPKRKKEFNTSLNNSSGSLRVSQNSLSIGSHSPGRNYPQKKNSNPSPQNNNNESYQNINSSQTESMLNNSIFMRTIDEIKKEKNLNFYNEKISKKFLEKIEKNIEDNYEKIIDNIKNPFEIDEAKMINGLMLRDKTLSISSKIIFKNEKILKKNNYIDDKILTEFESTNKKIRSKNNNNSIIYDQYLNKCIYDTANELIEKERKYGIIGSPLFWSIRNRDIGYKYKNNDIFSKKMFVNKIMSQLDKILNSKMGLIAENYEYLDMEQLNSDRDKKFMESIIKELKDNEPCYQIFETQETYVKLSLSRIILDQLLNEIVEILEHVQYSRKEPDKYQSKSIYACEDIPRLSFQPQTMENNYSGNFDGDNDQDESINQ